MSTGISTQAFTGTRGLIQLAGKRDRIMLPIWIYVLVGTAASSAYSIKGVYPDQASRDALTSSTNAVFGVVALYGPIQSPTVGGIISWKIALVEAVLAAVMSILLVVRHTRAEEQTGRQELLGAAPLGRCAPATAALGLVAVANLAFAVVSALALAYFTGSFAGSLVLGLAIGGVGLVFGALAAVTAQLSESSRTANGIAASALGALYLVRAAADSGGPGWLAWCTPIGWLEKARPYAGDRWWVLVLYLAATLALAAGALRLAGGRDLGAGLLPSRPGAPRAGRDLRGVGGLAWRLQRGALIGWSAGFVIAGAALGALAKDVGTLVNSSSAQAEQVIERMGGQPGIENAYLSAMNGIMGVLAGAYAIQAALRARGEESAGHAEALLAGPVGRIRWMATHLVMALAGAAVLLTVYGVGVGLADGIRGHDVSSALATMIGAALAQWPAVALIAGLTVLAVGAAPRYAPLAWAVLLVSLLLSEFGPVLRLAQPVLDVSPFTHVPKLPGTEVAWAPLVWLAVIAAALIGGALTSFRRRDLTT
ncbi:MAG TPA: ABC transporter permease [Actinocrinis sp.]|jgi:ABC-2 type transport system permease protein